MLNEGYLFSFTATVDNVDSTRTEVDLKNGSTSYGKVSFVNGDQVVLYNGTQSAIFTYDSTLSLFKTESRDFAKSSKYYAFYPASSVESFSEAGVSVNIAQTQLYSKDLVSDAPLFAISESESFHFKNIFAILKVAMKGNQQISNIVFTSSKRNIAGKATITPSYDVIFDDASNNTVTISCSDAQLSQTGDNFFLSLPAGVYPSGFEMVVNFADGTSSVQSTTSDIVLSASKIDAMDIFTASSTLFSGGCGTMDDPYLIASSEDIKTLSQLCNDSSTASSYLPKYYRQTKDIDMSSSSGIYPIGYSSTLAFSGKYDGCNHSIKGLRIVEHPAATSESEGTYCGMFGMLQGEICNLKLDISFDATKINSGAVAGYAKNAKISSCDVSCNISSSALATFDGYTDKVSNIGGIVGLAEKSTIEKCNVTGTIISAGYSLGGVSGHCISTLISKCSISESTKLDGKGPFVGGIAGRARTASTLEQCVVSGKIGVYSGNYIGGIVGQLTASSARNCVFSKSASLSTNGNHTGGIVGAFQVNEAGCDEAVVENCTSYPKIFGAQNVGGICGYMGVSDTYKSQISIRNCTSYGNVSATSYYAGGIVGTLTTYSFSTIENCKSYGDISSDSHSVGGIVGYGISKQPALIGGCIAYGNLLGLYSVGGIAGYIKCNDKACNFDIVNSIYAGKTLEATGNNGANGYTLVAGLVGWVQVASGTFSMINSATRAEKLSSYSAYGTYPSTNNTLGGLVGFINGKPTSVLSWGCYSTVSKSSLSTDGVSFSTATPTTLYGGVYAKVHSDSCPVYSASYCYFNPDIQVGPSVSKLPKFDLNTVCAYQNGESLLENLNKSVKAYSGTYTLLGWVMDKDGYPVLEGMTTEREVSHSKRISVIGDSISTFRGFVPSGYSCHYPTSDGDLTHVTQTYWYRLAYDKMTDAVIDKNISFSGTAVARTTATAYSSKTWFGKDYCFRYINKRGMGQPDIILIHGGTNDYAHNVDELAPGVAMRSTTAPSDSILNSLFETAEAAKTLSDAEKLNDTTFCEAYIKLIRMMNLQYPSVKIVCIVGDYLSTGIEQSVIKICNRYDNLRCVDLMQVNGFNDQTYMPKHDYNPSTGSGCHPSSKAMEFIANKIYTELGAWLEL